MEEEQKDLGFQDCVLSIHHAFMLTFSRSSSYKIIENHDGKAFVQHVPPR